MIGIDTTSIQRIKKAIEKKPFRDGVFTESEQKYCDGRPRPEESYAGIFCAKEAAVKAAKCGFGVVKPIDIEVSHDEHGAPLLSFKSGTKAAEVFGKYDCDLSISHDGDYAVAVVMLNARI
ncbi:MAG: holo-ACP synthase [Clostridiales bacterium]|nr:holo-ACP synthase [Clostridiales bacterium]